MGPGRPRKPTAQKKLEGTARKDRANTNEIMPSTIEHPPSAPKYLSAAAKKEWKMACTELIKMGILANTDLALLSAYCNEMGSYIEACDVIRKEGMIMTFERGDGGTYSQQHPAVGIKNAALSNALKIANQFGFTPAARARIEAPEKGEDPLMAAMKKLQQLNG
ncbi:MAG: phage terminase small subunit P27 family [Dyadobacter sp.]|uniref:phage terminase small subunit P27 family n=1 Tax=Dyadobacter sp. TaxID=1914288 RepID=UPI001B273FBA|nr:phage terminase small subunit P27 family [Dyadobacter sp.]MBO9612535.1 phage terminase small subunit P27 family [Dyadobacter sp.]